MLFGVRRWALCSSKALSGLCPVAIALAQSRLAVGRFSSCPVQFMPPSRALIDAPPVGSLGIIAGKTSTEHRIWVARPAADVGAGLRLGEPPPALRLHGSCV